MEHTNRLLATKWLVESGVISAPSSFLGAPLTQLESVCNGCGKANSKFDYIPDNIIGTYIGYACFIHDWQYDQGRNKEDKIEADNMFKKNLLILTKLETPSAVVVAIKYAVCVTYYLGVKHFGYKSFWRGKNVKQRQ